MLSAGALCVCLTSSVHTSMGVFACVHVAANPSEDRPLPNESIMWLSRSSPLVAWYGVGLGKVAVSLHTHAYTHIRRRFVQKLGFFMALSFTL